MIYMYYIGLIHPTIRGTDNLNRFGPTSITSSTTT